MALFKPYKITSDKLADLPVREGQIIITTDTTKLYVDISATERIEVKSDAEVDLTDYVTTNVLTAALAEETKEREKQDDLLNDSIAEKLDQGQADDRYALKYNPNLSGNVNILNENWIAGKITAAHSNGEIEDYYKYVIGFDAIHRPYIAKKEGDNNVSMIYLGTNSIVFNKPLSFTGSSGIESNPEAASQTRQNIGAAAINHTHDVATAGAAGFMSAEDKTKLDGLEQVDTSVFVTKEDADADYAAISHIHDDRYYTESEVDSKLADKANATHTHTIANVTNLQETIDGLEADIAGKANVSHTHDDRYFTETEITDKLATKADTGHKHAASDVTSGTFALDRIPTITDAKISGMSASKLTGTIPTANLPSYVDDVVEGATTEDFPKTGEAGKIYVATSTNKTYRWSGSGYVEISASLALGTTSSTAFRGDYGNVAYTHATAKGAAFASGLYKITTNSQGHVTAATAVTKSDITALGIPGSDTNTNTTYELTKSGSTITLEGSDGSSTSVTDSNTVYTHPTTPGNKHIPAGGSSGQILRWSADGTAAWGADNNTNTTYTLSKSGSTITLTGSDGSKTSVTDSDTNTTYTLGSFGITATAAELNKLDGVTATATEINYLDGVTSAIQTQLNGKAASSHTHTNATTAAAGFLPKLGGGTTNFLRADGTWAKPPDTNTTYSDMKGATTSAAGTHGLVPAPAAGAANRYLRSDGVWSVPPDTNTNTTYTLSKSGSTITLTGSDGNKTSVTDSNTTYSLSSFGITATAAELNKLDGVTTTATQLNYLNTLTSNVQTQLNGKASSSHTHYNLSFRGAVGATTNWNSLSDGIWSVGQSTFSATYNQPVGAYTCGTLRVYNNGSNIAQIYIAHSNGQMWFRDRFSSSNDFTSWARTYTTLSKPTASEIGAAASSHSHSNYLTTSGTAAAATKLATARTFSLTGDVTGSASFNGTANCSIATTLAANSVTANEIASGAVGLSELASTVGTIAVQSSAPTDSHVKLWIKV